MKQALLFDDRNGAVICAMTGGVLGVAFYLLLSWLTQPGSLFGGPMGLDFTFCFNSNVPEVLGAALGFLLWFFFGPQAGLSTLPFADGGKSLLLRSLAHFGAMTLTMWAWVMLNFTYEPLPGLILSFQLPLTLIYILIWLGRWVGWYAEVGQSRERLGLTGGRSPLKWRETLPHIGFAAVLCFAVPTVLRLCGAHDVPVLSGLLYPYLLLPVVGFCSGYSLGRRQGFCPLYPLACVISVSLFVLTAKLYSNMADGALLLIALCFPLAGSALGALMRLWRRERMRKDL